MCQEYILDWSQSKVFLVIIDLLDHPVTSKRAKMQSFWSYHHDDDDDDTTEQMWTVATTYEWQRG